MVLICSMHLQIIVLRIQLSDKFMKNIYFKIKKIAGDAGKNQVPGIKKGYLAAGLLLAKTSSEKLMEYSYMKI